MYCRRSLVLLTLFNWKTSVKYTRFKTELSVGWIADIKSDMYDPPNVWRSSKNTREFPERCCIATMSIITIVSCERYRRSWNGKCRPYDVRFCVYALRALIVHTGVWKHAYTTFACGEELRVLLRWQHQSRVKTFTYFRPTFSCYSWVERVRNPKMHVLYKWKAAFAWGDDSGRRHIESHSLSTLR